MRTSLGASSDGGVPLRKTPPPSLGGAQQCMPHASPPVLDLQDVFSRACCLLNPHDGSAAAAGGGEALPHHEQSPSCNGVGSEASVAASCSPTASLTGSDSCSASSNMVDTSSGSVSPEDSDPEDCSCSRRTWNYSSASEYHGEEHDGWQSRATFMQQQYQQRARPMRQQHMGAAAAAWDAQMQQQMAVLQQPTFWQHMQMHAHAQHQQQEQQQQRSHHAYLGQQLPPFGSANGRPYFQPQQQQQPPPQHGRISQEYRRGDREHRRGEGGGGGFRFAPMTVYADPRWRSDRPRRHQHQHSMSPLPLPPPQLLPAYPARGSYPYGGAHHSHSPTPLAQRSVSARQHAWADVSSGVGGGGGGAAAASCDLEVMRQHCLSMHAHAQAQSQPLFIVPVPAACGASYRSSSRLGAGAPRPCGGSGGGGGSCADEEDRLLDDALAALYEDTERALCRHAGEVMAGKQLAAKRATERWLATQTQAQRDAYMQRVGLSS